LFDDCSALAGIYLERRFLFETTKSSAAKASFLASHRAVHVTPRLFSCTVAYTASGRIGELIDQEKAEISAGEREKFETSEHGMDD
jgi:hypothetical protein